MLTLKKATVALVLLMSLVFSFQTKAQWVAIPDANFVIELLYLFPSCMNGNLMDTTCAGIINANRLSITLASQNLDGIQYFDNLDSLECFNGSLNSLPALPNSLTYLLCSSTNLVNLPPLPNTLKYLDCNTNQFTNLPVLPASLTFLDCHQNQLINLPALPSSMTFLNFRNNNITNLPILPTLLTFLDCSDNLPLTNLNSLPNSLTTLRCSNNQFTIIPILPSNLNELDCSNNQLTNLPMLPIYLTKLNCYNNQLVNLPTLPPALTFLGCYSNQLTILPSLPPNLAILYCDNNQLTNLPPLPNNLTELSCAQNQLIEIPLLPSNLTDLSCYNNQLNDLPLLPPTLTRLYCFGNQISCFPLFPISLVDYVYFIISSNPFTCLPNYVPAMDSTTLSIPLCIDNDPTNNPNACQGFKGVIGYAYKDDNSNCVLDGSDSFIQNIPIQLFNSTSILTNTFYTLTNGVYNYILDTATYTVAIDTANKPYSANCLYPGIDSTFTLTTANPLAKNVNFEIGCKSGFDVGVKSINATGNVFPDLPHRLNIAAGDLSKWYNLNCAGGVNGVVSVAVSGPVAYVSIPANALTPTNISGNIFTYNIADFGTINLNAFAIWFTTDSTAQTGDPICVTVNVTPTIGDNDTTNNELTFCYLVTNSFDPNDKHVYPATVPPLYNDWFTYTIRFQNVGTAAAQNIRVVDTLASNLDLSTFEIINYSHANTSTLTGSVATFRFPNIQLPDSTSNPEGSKGFIQYRIKPVANLPLGTQIENTANIYFDFNSPVVTNTAVSTYSNTVGISNTTNKNYLSVYPNPGKGIYHLRFANDNNAAKRIEVLNLVGEVIYNSTFKNNNVVVDLSQQANGIYVLRVVDDGGSYVVKIVKE